MAITQRSVVFATPWFELLAKTVDQDSNPFYSLSLNDYICMTALTESGDILLVRQYRPAVERVTLEIPAGMVDPGESPETAARRELIEETGYEAHTMELLGSLCPDTGRLSNTMWCFFAKGVKPVRQHSPEAGLEVERVPASQLASLIEKGAFDHALHVACIMMASIKHGASLFGARS